MKKYIIIFLVIFSLFRLTVSAMQFNPGSGNITEGTTQTVTIVFDRPETDNYTTVNVNLDTLNITVLGVTEGDFMTVAGCSNSQRFMSNKVCFTATTSTGAFESGDVIATLSLRWNSPGTATITGNDNDPYNINGYYRTMPTPTFLEQTGVLATYTVIGIIPATALEIDTVTLVIGVGASLIIAGLLLRKYINNKIIQHSKR